MPACWLEFVIAYHTQQGHGKAAGWKGFEGMVKFYEMRQAAELDLLPRLPWRQIVVPHVDWALDRQDIKEFLASEVPPNG
jgi:hypothetical protein